MSDIQIQPSTPTVDVPTTTPTPTEGGKPQVKAEDKTPEAATEGENTDGTTTTDDGQKPEKGEGGYQRRINRLTSEKYRERARAEQLEARLRELESKSQQPQAKAQDTDLKAPRVEDFKSYEDYERARDDYLTEKVRRDTKRELEEQRKASEAKQAEETERERITKAREQFDKRAEEVAESFEDFDDMLSDLYTGNHPAKALDRQGLEFIFEGSERGPELMHKLWLKPEEARRIAALRPVQQVAELARLEASLTKPAAKTTQAPPPPKTVGPRGGSDGKDPEKMTIEEMRKATGTRRIVRD
jgi:hypothetical protein